MKKLALFASLAAVGSLTSLAEETKSSYSVTLDFPFTSKYVFRGLEAAKQSVQPSVELTSGPVYVGVWSNLPVTRHLDNEFDFYAGYKYRLNDAWDIDAGATLYYYPELNTSGGAKSHTVEGYLGINGNIKGFTPGLYTYRDFDLKTTTVQAQVGYSIPAAELGFSSGPASGLSIDFSVNGGRVFADAGGAYSYWSTGINLPYKLPGGKATVYTGLSYSNSNLKDVRRDLVSWTAGVSIGF